MKRWLKNGSRFIFVTLGIVLLTSFSIDATDTLRGSQTALGIFTEKMTASKCPSGMVMVQGTDYQFCIDEYEASPSADCIITEPKSVADTAHNIADSRCELLTEPNKKPWTYVAQPQAEQLCAKAGKSLPTAAEWYEAALGTPDNTKNCNLNGLLLLTGSRLDCLSGVGAYDMVGNVWELIKAEVFDGNYDNRKLPVEGYVESVDNAGVALETAEDPNDIYNKDYYWSKDSGRYAIIRGGYYGSGFDGGIYAVHAQTDKNFASAAIGFRCVKRMP